MTTASSNPIPLAVDYTGRDYYALREQLIERVKDRLPDWQGSDPSDFGLALVEAFSYMGDLVNYYIDRVANESYILTATQRSTLLNLASMYGYKAGDYVSASVTLTADSYVGYVGGIGGAVVEEGTVSGLPSDNYLKIIVPNDHPFDTTDSANNTLVVSSMPSTVPGKIGGVDVTYDGSVFNGTYKVAYVGYNTFGRNVLWYRPAAEIDNAAAYSVTGLTASSTGTVVTYVGSHQFQVGDTITITGFTTTAYNLSSVTVATVDDNLTYFTVNSSVTAGSATGTGTATSSNRFILTLSENNRSMSPLPGQKVLVHGVTVSAGANYNGQWVIDQVNEKTSTTNTQLLIDVNDSDTVANISKAVVSGSNFIYSAWTEQPSVDFVVGETVNIRNIKSSENTGGTADSGYNLTGAVVTATKDITASISRITTAANGSTPSNTDITCHVSEPFTSGDLVTIRNVVSTANPSGTKNVEYNLADQVISSVSTVTATINDVKGEATSGAGRILYQTTAIHDFKLGDFVTITGVVNNAGFGVDATDVYNLTSAKIIAVDDYTFTVQGWWSNAFNAASSTSATATAHSFRIDNVSGTFSNDPAAPTGGIMGAITRYFTVAASGTPGTWATPSTQPTATPVIGGTYSSSTTDEVVYANLPAMLVSGPTVKNTGYTIIPAGTQVSTQVTIDGSVRDIIFSTQADAAIPYGETATNILAIHGEDISLRTENAKDPGLNPGRDINGELIGSSNGKANQSFTLKEVQVPPRSVRVFVDTGTIWEEWLQVEHVQDFSPTSKVFEVTVDASEAVIVTFGDGISGLIPVKESGIKAQYLAGGGLAGNVSAGTLTTWHYVPGNDADVIKSSIKVYNPSAATGGTDPESNDSIRYNAPRALRALNRAVTLDDYSNLALSVDGIAKANSVSGNRSSVTIYIAPVSSDNSGDDRPGLTELDAATPQMEQYYTLVKAYLADKIQIGTTITVLPPTYKYINTVVSYSALPQYNAAAVSEAIKKQIVDEFSYNNVDFADVITPEEVEFKLRQVDGVANVRVTELYRTGGSGRNSLIGEPDEIFVFNGSYITVNQTSSACDLTGLTITVGGVDKVITPAINADVYSYTVTVPTGTTELTLNPSNSTDSTVTINDKAVTGDTIVIDHFNAPGNIAVTVTAQDGVTVKTYKVRVLTA